MHIIESHLVLAKSPLKPTLPLFSIVTNRWSSVPIHLPIGLLPTAKLDRSDVGYACFRGNGWRMVHVVILLLRVASSSVGQFGRSAIRRSIRISELLQYRTLELGPATKSVESILLCKVRLHDWKGSVDGTVVAGIVRVRLTLASTRRSCLYSVSRLLVCRRWVNTLTVIVSTPSGIPLRSLTITSSARSHCRMAILPIITHNRLSIAVGTTYMRISMLVVSSVITAPSARISTHIRCHLRFHNRPALIFVINCGLK